MKKRIKLGLSTVWCSVAYVMLVYVYSIESRLGSVFLLTTYWILLVMFGITLLLNVNKMVKSSCLMVFMLSLGTTLSAILSVIHKDYYPVPVMYLVGLVILYINNKIEDRERATHIQKALSGINTQQIAIRKELEDVISNKRLSKNKKEFLLAELSDNLDKYESLKKHNLTGRERKIRDMSHRYVTHIYETVEYLSIKGFLSQIELDSLGFAINYQVDEPFRCD